MLKKRKTPIDALFPEREGIRVYPISNKNKPNSKVMTEKELEIANSLRQKKNKSFDAWQELILLKDEHLSRPEAQLSLSKIGHGWVSIHPDDKAEVFDIILKKAKARFDEAVEAFRNYQPKNKL